MRVVRYAAPTIEARRRIVVEELKALLQQLGNKFDVAAPHGLLTYIAVVWASTHYKCFVTVGMDSTDPGVGRSSRRLGTFFTRHILSLAFMTVGQEVVVVAVQGAFGEFGGETVQPLGDSMTA